MRLTLRWISDSTFFLIQDLFLGLLWSIGTPVQHFSCDTARQPQEALFSYPCDVPVLIIHVTSQPIVVPETPVFVKAAFPHQKRPGEGLDQGIQAISGYRWSSVYPSIKADHLAYTFLDYAPGVYIKCQVFTSSIICAHRSILS